MPAANSSFSLADQSEVFFTSTATSRAIRRLLDAGQIRAVGGRLYTKNLVDPLDEILRRRVWDVAAGYFPGAVIVDRTAFELRPSGEEGSVFLSGPKSRSVRLPGLVLNCRQGPGPVDGDQRFLAGGLYLSSYPRRFLDNMRPSRARGGARRTLTRSEMEDRLREILAKQGPGEVNRLRDEAAVVADALQAGEQFHELQSLIGALLGTVDASLSSAGARATAAGQGSDDARLPLFDALLAALHGSVVSRRTPHAGHTGSTFAFYEAYFSNFIEGTEFTLQEARDIVFGGEIPADRPADAHDVLGTFDLVGDPSMQGRTPADAGDLETIAQAFHRRIMAGRPELTPGEYKVRANRAGNTEFVAPALVRGTLRQGWERYRTLPQGLARAIFVAFLIAEVHPFTDGNGRVARALANAELTAADQQRLIIPTVLRDDYLHALRALSRDAHATPLVRVFDRAQAWAHEVDWSSVEAARDDLEATNALLTSAEADDRGVILRLPSEVARRAS
jgi:Fic/DOC family protein